MHFKKHLRAASLLITVILIFASVGIGNAAGESATSDRIDVLISFHVAPGPQEQALVRAYGGEIEHTFNIVPTIAANIPAAAAFGLSHHPLISAVEQNGKVYAIDAELDNTWGVKRIGADDVHANANKGAGVAVAVIDSGIDYTHEELDGNYAGGQDFVNDDMDPMDDNGHGTHVSGTVAAEDNGIGVVGAAPEADLYGLKVLGADGSGSFGDVIAALDWAVANGIQVTNNSYGSSMNPGTAVRAAFDNSAAAGILHIAAAGNSGNPRGKGNNVGYPARYDSVVAVAATDSDDTRASFSSTGPAVELAAPGVAIRSTLPGGGYADWNGTSMASPHVAGTAALVIAAGAADASTIRSALQETAEDLGEAGRDNKYGFGLVSAAAAVAAVGPVEPITDIAIASVSAPSAVVQGDNARVTVTVDNSGNQDVTSDIVVALTDETDGQTIGTQTVSGLAAGASVDLEFIWDTNGASFGDHTLTAAHGQLDNNSANDQRSTTVTIMDASVALHVGDIDAVKNIKGKSGKWEALVTITVHDQDENPVAGATVTTDWTGAVSGTGVGTTGSDGTVTFTTGNMTGSSFTCTVTAVEHSLTYDSAANHDSDGDSDGTSITVFK